MRAWQRNTRQAENKEHRACRTGACNRHVCSCMLAALIVISFVAIAHCCSVPVFRYALEHWTAESLVIHVIGSNRQLEEYRALIDSLEISAKAANLRVSIQNENTLGDSKLNGILHEASQASDLKWSDNSALMVLENTKPSNDGSPLLWKGALTDENISKLLRSPVRQKIAQALAEDVSVFWVFIDSSDPIANDAKFNLLNSELHRLESSIRLPELDPEDLIDRQSAVRSQTLRFGLKRVERSDPSEQVLKSMLLASEGDLDEQYQRGLPIAFPIFGRGRVLYALVGDGISPINIEDACRFLCSACQCTIKQENPGTDLLFSFEWEKHVKITSKRKESQSIQRTDLVNQEMSSQQVLIPQGASRKENESTQPISGKRDMHWTSMLPASMVAIAVATVAFLALRIARGIVRKT